MSDSQQADDNAAQQRQASAYADRKAAATHNSDADKEDS